MPENLATVRVTNQIELAEAGEALRNAWFRGQGSAQWRLQSTLERDAERFGVPSRGLWNREQVMFNLFKERAHLYSQASDLPSSTFEWFALIRHYGGPSRLLDITSSCFVAAYFALSDSLPNTDSAIWAFTEQSITTQKPANLESMFQSGATESVVAAEPERLNARIHAQSGGFLIPGSVEIPLEEQISKKFDTNLNQVSKYRSVRRIGTEISHRIWKLVIPRDVHSELFRFLSRCNVRAYSLFPGMDGLGSSLREMMRAYE
jgi:hypothetical protein